MINLIKKIEKENNYSGSNWNYERTTKYLLSMDDINMDGIIIEAGFFLHYKKESGIQVLKKSVIELPSSYGCPVKCSFCASSRIGNARRLTFEEIVELFRFIYSDQAMHLNEAPLLVSMTGIGDYSLNYDQINRAIISINELCPEAWFTVSSSIWTKNVINQVRILSDAVKIRAVNITFVSVEESVVKQLIGYYRSHLYDFDALVSYIKETRLSNIRINYIMIEGANDRLDDFARFAESARCIRDRIIVRVSRMNRTQSADDHGLTSPDIKKLLLCQQYLQDQGFTAYVFYSEKDDQMNCGQLVTEGDPII